MLDNKFCAKSVRSLNLELSIIYESKKERRWFPFAFSFLFECFNLPSLVVITHGRSNCLQQRKREMVASAFGEDESGSRQTRLTVEDLKYLFMV